MSSEGLWIGVLGPLLVRDGPDEIEVRAPLTRRLLALLAAGAGQDVATGSLIDGLWDGSPPAAAAATLQSHVARLRRGLPDGALETRPGGYRLRATTDAAEFEKAAAAGEAPELRRGLDLWRGVAYEGLRDAEVLADEATHLDRLREDAAINCLRAELEVDTPATAERELTDLLTTTPTREELWTLLMLVHYRSGRRGEALATYQRARSVLRDELGADPGPELARMEQRILTQDPSLDVAPQPDPPVAQRRRLVTAVAVELTGFGNEDDEDAMTMARRRAEVGALIQTYGGSALPSPGQLMFAAFGAEHAHDDDPARAVDAARQLMCEELSARAGVATGVAVVTAAGALRDGSAVTRRAEALCRAAAPGVVATDAATSAALASTGGGQVVPFVGRGLDLELLRQELDRAVQRTGAHLVTVVAEAGMGKSRLAAEFLSSLEDRATTRRAICRSYGTATGRAVISELLDADPGPQANERDQQFKSWRDRLAQAADASPLVVHLDDMQWADDLVVDFTAELLRHGVGQPLLVIATARPEFLAERPTWGQSATSSCAIRLEPMSTGEIEAILGAVAADDAAARRQWARAAAGVPLLALELARGGTVSSGESAGSHLGKLRRVVAARMDTLSPAARDVLIDAAVCDSPVDAGLLAALTPRTDAEIAGAVEELIDRSFMRRVDGRTAVVHDVIRETAVDQLLPIDRAQRHLDACRWGRSHGADVAWLAHHAFAAHDLASHARQPELAAAAGPIAAEYAAQAADEALGLDTSTALQLFQRAVELHDPAHQGRSRARLGLGMALFDAGRFVEADRELRQGLHTLGDASDPIRASALARLFGVRVALAQDVGPVVKQMAVAATEIPPCAETVHCLAGVALATLLEQTPTGFQSARQLADDALRVATEAGLAGYAGLAHVVRGRARLAAGDEGGLEEMVEGTALSRDHDPTFVTACAEGILPGAMHHWRGPEAEIQARAESEAYATSRGVTYWIAFSAAEHIRCLAESGRLREAIAAADSIESGGDPGPKRWAVVQRALALVDLGELDADTVSRVRATPPSAPDDLRHVLGVALVEAAWDPCEVPNIIERLGNLQAFVARDGAAELVPRLIRVAREAGLDVEALRHPPGTTPLAQAIAAHANGLIDQSASLLEEAAAAWEAMGFRTEARHARLDAATARGC